MPKTTLIEKLTEALNFLPEDKAKQVLAFAEFKVHLHTKSAVQGNNKTDVFSYDDDVYLIKDIKRD